MKRARRFFAVLLAAAMLLPNAAAVIPIRDIEPHWYPYFNGQQWDIDTPVPPVPIAPGTTGFHSMSMFANIDYKQDLQSFRRLTTQYPTMGYIEWFHELSEFIPVHYETGNAGHQRPPIFNSGVSAYDAAQQGRQSQFDISLGQWMNL